MMGGPRTYVCAEYFENHYFYYKYHKKQGDGGRQQWTVERRSRHREKRNKTVGTCLVFGGGNAKETKIYIFKWVSWQGCMLSVLIHTDHTHYLWCWLSSFLVWHGSWCTVGYVCLALIFRNDQKSNNHGNLTSLILSISGNVPWKQFIISTCRLTAIILNITDSMMSEHGLSSLNLTPEHFHSLIWQSELFCNLFRLVLSLLIGVLTHLCVYECVSVCYELTRTPGYEPTRSWHNTWPSSFSSLSSVFVISIYHSCLSPLLISSS